MELDWKSIAGTVAPLAPKLGSVLGTGLGGPLGGVIGGLAGSALAAAFGVEATPEAVGKAITERDDSAEVIQQVEADRGEEIRAQAEVQIQALKEFTEQERLANANTQDARETQLVLQGRGSLLAYGPTALSVMIVAGFFGSIFIFMSRPPTMTEATLSIVSLLIGKLSTSFDTVVQYHLGSSAGSKNNADRFAALAQTIVQKPNPAPEAVAAIKAVAKKK